MQTLKREMKNFNQLILNNSSMLIKLYLPWFFIFLFFTFIRLKYGIQLRIFISDPAAIADMPFYYGLLSNLGVLILCSGASISIFSSLLLFKIGKSTDTVRFLFILGVFTAVLCIDDLYMIHEIALPIYLSIPEELTFILYGIIFITILYKFKNSILKETFYPLFLFSCILLITSVIMDIFCHYFFNFSASRFFEDGPKLVGFFSLSTYLVMISINSFSINKK